MATIFLFVVRVGNFFVCIRVDKKLHNCVIFFAVTGNTKKSFVVYFFRGQHGYNTIVSCVNFIEVNARTKKVGASCNIFFCGKRDHPVFSLANAIFVLVFTAKKKNYITLQFFWYPHLPKKKITQLNLKHILPRPTPGLPCFAPGLVWEGIVVCEDCMGPPVYPALVEHTRPVSLPRYTWSKTTVSSCYGTVYVGIVVRPLLTNGGAGGPCGAASEPGSPPTHPS